jgi:hypothetical protein
MAPALQRCPAMLRVGVLAWLWIGVACYAPQRYDCTLQCDTEADCGADHVCSRGWCTTPGIACASIGGTIDSGSSGIDGEVPDHDANGANAACTQACTIGTCDHGVCVIDCNQPGACSTKDVYCPAGIPCRIECGDGSCGKKLGCTDAAACEVLCTGAFACGDEILCPSDRPCSVTCSGYRSCDRKIKCSSACACDVRCEGASSCREVSECPDSSCRFGNGCTSAFAGCNAC